jgi:hypothetical protein
MAGTCARDVLGREGDDGRGLSRHTGPHALGQVTTCNLGRRVICRRHRATGVELYVRLTPIDIRPTKPAPLFASLSIDLLPPLRKIESVAFRVARAPRLEYGDRL